MRVTPAVVADAGAVGAAAADIVLARLATHPADRRFLLGCPGGRSPLTTYAALGREAGERGLDLSRLVVVMMDEYVVRTPSGDLVAEDPGAAHSCRRFGRVEIVDRLNAGLDPARRVPSESLWVPDPGDPDAYDGRIAEAGGVDVFLLASGATDGHIGFNPPGSGAFSRCRIVDLPDSTRRDNLVTFPSFGGRLDAVPQHGVTVGIGTIRELSHEVVMVLHGSDKREAARRLTRATAYDPDWPATILADCRTPHLILDEAAADATA
ncbi:putative Glucosamine-6-phosphate deaminase [Nostocoides japonicum T1-X7]|uniref:Putative Glucosamine-6-phosphate deaminase n=1 Tax=Nostocoides japonicum T1-X7 TaxID=1194083 RepID=A0A077LVN1_9MICO|nr:hypothetical protein [Tetrasphaera japonica]CCH76049.1 putative Glucosamine-6-phosphate deaminase [Tetrasphaera japonica T1-X7]